jgi:hypothetical protein
MRRRVKLEGERLIWFELAYHLHTSVEQLQAQITYSEFLEWQEFFRLETEKHTKADWYMAQLAAEIRMSFVSEPKKVRMKDFLLRFATPEEITESSSEDARRQHIARSKAAWFFAVKMPVKEKK